MPTILAGDFEWDSEKAVANEEKHGVTFEEAATVFLDPRAQDQLDAEHPENVVTIGLSRLARALYVVSTERGERIRIISARKATPAERRLYSER